MFDNYWGNSFDDLDDLYCLSYTPRDYQLKSITIRYDYGTDQRKACEQCYFAKSIYLDIREVITRLLQFCSTRHCRQL